MTVAYEAMQAHHYDPDKSDIRGWFASRKLDGFRGIYKPGLGLFSLGRYSGTKQINCPSWWLKQLPNLSLDGEIWHESDDLGIIKSIAGQGPAKGLQDPRWELLTFQAFDVRRLDVDWTTRQTFLNDCKENDVYKIVPQTQVWNHAELKYFSKALGPKAEGFMVSNPLGYYEYKRSYNILKGKNTFDYEAFVYGFEYGKDDKKYSDKVGALCCRLVWPEHITSVRGGDISMVGMVIHFNMSGLPDEYREIDYFNKNLLNKTVNFTYYGVSKDGVPKSANFKGVVE